MLVLSRKKKEAILISGRDGDIRIVVLEVEKGRIRIGIEAPKGVRVLREELLEEARRMNELSAITDVKRIEEIKKWKKE